MAYCEKEIVLNIFDVICSGNIPKHNKGGLSRLCMAKISDWDISELSVTGTVNEEGYEPFIDQVRLAREMLETMIQVEKTGLDVRIPRAAYEFVENNLSDWFEEIATIEKTMGNRPYLIDRSLYSPADGDHDISWRQGLTLKDIDEWLDGSPYGMDYNIYRINEKATKTGQPLSGYFNRLLPIKFVLRVLAIMIVSSDSFNTRTSEENWEDDFDGEITLTALREESLSTALFAREYLLDLDQRAGATRGTEIAVGFPENTPKARERFVAQFVGSKRGKSLSGALVEMGFANVGAPLGISLSSEVRDWIRFTYPGWRFVMMENPVIDSLEGFVSGPRFSDDEVSFLLNHFKQNVPGEWAFLMEIAKLIDSGIDRPMTMQEEIVKSRKWDDAKASIMRNGVLSRMQELGLISREKKGREVTYSLTKSGKSYFEL